MLRTPEIFGMKKLAQKQRTKIVNEWNMPKAKEVNQYVKNT